MKKLGVIILMATLSVCTVWARGYDIDDSDEFDISGVDRIVFTIDEPRCITCIKTVDVQTVIEGRHSGNRLFLSLEGNIRSNRRKAVPRLLTEKNGRELRVSIYPRRLTVIGLISRGHVTFRAGIPSEFTGDIEIFAGSSNISLLNFNAKDLKVKNSSGNIEARTVSAEDIAVKCSSGNMVLEEIRSSGDLKLESSSGRIDVDDIDAAALVDISLSSGKLTGSIIRAGEIKIHSTSGNLEIDSLISEGSVMLDASSGTVRSESISAEFTELKNHSGNITIGSLVGGLQATASSGNVTINIPEVLEPVDIDCSSGKIRLIIPKGNRYSVDLSTSSGSITLDDQVLGIVDSKRDDVVGDVNGGGPLVRLHTSSGNITILNR